MRSIWEEKMVKVLDCGSVFPGCDYQVHGPTDAEVIVKELDHAHAAHDLGPVSTALRERIRTAIREDKPAERAR
jgi:predicted small metal-binding protein